MSSSNPTASGVLSVSDSSPTYLRDHASSVTAPTKDEIRLKKEALESLYESAERALSSLDRSAVESIRTQIGDELEVIGEMYSRRIQSLPKGEEREWLKSERKNAILNFDEFETRVEETLTRHLGTVTTTDQIASAETVMSRPASFRTSNPYLLKLKSTESKSRSESHRSFSTTASEQGRRQAKIEKKLAQLELEAVERQNKLEAVERQNKLELEAVERRNKLEQRRLAAEIELRKAEAVDQILNDKESYRSRSARFSCKTSIPDDDRPVSAPNNLAAINDVLNFKRSACLQPSIVQMPTRSQIRTPLSQSVSVSEEQANLSHKGNDCSPLAAVVEYMSMPKLECPKFHGDPEDYCAFFRYFNENIHDKNIFSDQQKLAYLLQNTYGKAYDAISHCPSLQPASKGYEEARYILFESFGDPRIIAESFKRSLLQRSNVKPHNGSSMASYANALRKGLVTLEDLGDYSELNTVDCLKRLSDKLPQAVSYHWRRHYAKIYLEEKRKPTFSDFVTYVKREADILKAFPEQFLVSASDQTERRRVNEGGVRKNICATTTVSQSNAPSRFPRKGVSFSRSKELPAQQCYYCSKPDHLVYKCNDFLELSVAERERFVQESQRCHICFAKHATKDHRGSFRCRINNCGRRHNRLLHANTSALDNTSRQDEPRGTDETISGETCCYVNQSQRGFRVIVPVEVEARGVTVQTYAFLDTGSETSFIDKDLFSRLRIQESPRPVNIVTISQHSEPFEKYSVNLTVSSLMDDSVNFKIREVVKADALPVSPNAVVSLNDLLSLPHLQGVTIPKMNQDKVSLLIGLDCPNAHRILEMREGDGTQPNAVKTPFGWSLLGPAINRTEGNRDMQTYFVQSDEALDHEIRKSWFTEFEPDVINAPSSKEDREVATLLKNGVTHENGHFYAPLPWRSDVKQPRPPEAAAPFKGQLPDDFHFVENKQVAVSRVQETCGTVDDLIVRFSSLYRLKVACAWHRRFIAFLKDKSSVRKGGITVDELEAAELRLVAYVQRQVFGPVFKILESEVRLPNKVIKRELKENSQLRCLYKTSPILFEGLLRVGGRLEYATIDFSAKHPAILPYQHHLTNLLIRYHHVKCGHSGTSFTWTSIRQKYWILKGGAAVRRELNQCVICRKRSVPRGQQQMADLPRSRLVSNEPPFLYVGIDYFGPILVKRARSQLKRYGCVISCLTTRAVHIEVADDMTTDCFINAFRRFIARRGHPKKVFSDNGTNFKGAESILRKELSRLNQSKMDEYFKQTGIKWNFNPPAASHMGGAWERMIRSIRRILDILLKSQVVTDDVLHTLLLEVESILNSRPLCPITLDPHGNEPLTPNHLLLMRQSCNDPPGVFESRDCYGRRRWRQVQYLADSFWKRWRREYLPTIALRQKWPDKERNFQNGDLVLVVDDGVPRGKWRMGQVISTFPDPNGVVRQVEVKIGVSVLRRPIVKLCLICESNQASTNGPSVSDQ